jgi:hypothetical protein
MRETAVENDLPSRLGGGSERGGPVGGKDEEDARKQALFREVNERIGQLAVGSDLGGHDSYICECGSPQCTELITLTRAEYEAVRQHANRFAVLPDHQNPTTEAVVEQHDRYTVVETLSREASRIARDTDPRPHNNNRPPT